MMGRGSKDWKIVAKGRNPDHPARRRMTVIKTY
jgi:hypothetical protein